MEIRKGDVVSVEFVVDFISHGHVYCSAPGEVGTGTSFPLDRDGLKLIRRKFEVGEEASYRDQTMRTRQVVKILAMDGEHAWVRLVSGTAVTARIVDLDILPTIVESVDTPAPPIPGGNGTWVPAPADPLDPQC